MSAEDQTGQETSGLRFGMTPDGRVAIGIDPEVAAARLAESHEQAARQFDHEVWSWCWSRATSVASAYQPKKIEHCVAVFGQGLHPTRAEELTLLWRLAIILNPELLPGRPAAGMTAEQLWPLDLAARQLWTPDHARHRIRAGIFEAAARGTSLWAKQAAQQLLHPPKKTDHDGYWHDVRPDGWPHQGAMEILCDLLIQVCGGFRPGARVQVYARTPAQRWTPADAVKSPKGPAGFATSAVWMDNGPATRVRPPSWYVVEVDGGGLDWTVDSSALTAYPPARSRAKKATTNADVRA
ncbi:MAG: hypothetical protein QOF58_5641 [Pseudonocardiales bacterium]|jgi:hypothetical protein|nr:hypothetical protein [Pseudonocardiales bacterium]